MKNFKEYETFTANSQIKTIKVTEEVFIEEGFRDTLRNFFSAIQKKFRSALARLGFGQKIVFHLSNRMISEAGGASANLGGVYAEWVAAETIIEELHKLNIKVQSNGIASGKKKAYQELVAALSSRDKNLPQLEEKAGTAIGKSIVKEINDIGDLALLEVIVKHTGTESHHNKADIQITVSKRDQGQVLRVINASLKTATSVDINMTDGDWQKYLIRWFMPEGMQKTGISYRYNRLILNDHPLFKNLNTKIEDINRKVESVQEELKELKRKGIKTLPNGSAARARNLIVYKFYDGNEAKAKEEHVALMKEFASVLQQAFRSDKQARVRLVKMIGFDDETDFYIAVKNQINPKVVSSSTTTAFKTLVDDWFKGLNIECVAKSQSIHIKVNNTQLVRIDSKDWGSWTQSRISIKNF